MIFGKEQIFSRLVESGLYYSQICNKIWRLAYTNHISFCLFWESQWITSVQVLSLCQGRVFLSSGHSLPVSQPSSHVGLGGKAIFLQTGKGIMSGFLCQFFLWLKGEWGKGEFDFFLMTVFYHVVSLMFHYLSPFCADMNLPIGKPLTIYSSLSPPKHAYSWTKS